MERIAIWDRVSQLAEPGQKVWHILDFWHACDHLGPISKVLYGGAASSSRDPSLALRSLLRKGCVAKP